VAGCRIECSGQDAVLCHRDSDAARVLKDLDDRIKTLERGLDRPVKTPGPIKSGQDQVTRLSETQQRLAAEVAEIERVAGQLGLETVLDRRPDTLSGGQQQRVALARALVHTPRLVVADEPTGNLDSLTGQSIVAFFHAIVRETGVGLLVATHDSVVYSAADRVMQINDGVIVA